MGDKGEEDVKLWKNGWYHYHLSTAPNYILLIGDGEQTIICNAKDGQKTRNQEVECGLWIGTQPFVDAKAFNCQDADRDDVCVEFEADLYKDEHDELELYVNFT